MEYEQKIIKGLSIKYKEKTYSNILDLWISNYDETIVSFSAKESEDTTIHINAKLKDIEIIVTK